MGGGRGRERDRSRKRKILGESMGEMQTEREKGRECQELRVERKSGTARAISTKRIIDRRRERSEREGGREGRRDRDRARLPWKSRNILVHCSWRNRPKPPLKVRDIPPSDVPVYYFL